LLEAGDQSDVLGVRDGLNRPEPTSRRVVRLLLARPEQQDVNDIEMAWAMLNCAEQARAARFLFEHDRASYIVAHALARIGLARSARAEPRDLEFITSREGRPELAPLVAGPTSLRFNLSHTRGLVACAITSQLAVGVDVEVRRHPAPLDVARQHFSASEGREIECLPAEKRLGRFYCLWTLKEAYVKARGLGLALPLMSFDVAPLADGSAVLITREQGDRDENGADWTLRWWNLKYHAVAVAVRSRPSEVAFAVSAGVRIGALIAAGRTGGENQGLEWLGR